jgi:hypothetical protein
MPGEPSQFGSYLGLALFSRLSETSGLSSAKAAGVSSKMQLQRQTLDPVLSQLQPLFITRVARGPRGQCTVRPRRHRVRAHTAG